MSYAWAGAVITQKLSDDMDSGPRRLSRRCLCLSIFPLLVTLADSFGVFFVKCGAVS